MRRFILVAAMLLASVSAQAAGTRSLTLASATDSAATPQTASAPANESAKPADAPKYVDRPSAVSTAPVATTTTSTPAAATTSPAPQASAKASKPKRKPYWTEGRIISELHRHGIYW